MTAPLLAIRDLSKTFVLHGIDGRRVTALHEVSLDVAPGEHLALVGRSGAGKSSLLKCIHRTYRPTSGQIWFDADPAMVDLADLDDFAMARVRARDLGYVAQFLRAEPRRSVLDTVMGAGRRRGLSADRARVEATRALEAVGVDPSLWSTYPTLLSGGERQRVNLAAGVVRAPRLLLLDEPVSALDPHNRQAVVDLVAELPGRGITVVSVFHDLDAVRRLADRVVEFADGRIEREGSPSEILGDAGGSIGGPADEAATTGVGSAS